MTARRILYKDRLYLQDEVDYLHVKSVTAGIALNRVEKSVTSAKFVKELKWYISERQRLATKENLDVDSLRFTIRIEEDENECYVNCEATCTILRPLTEKQERAKIDRKVKALAQKVTAQAEQDKKDLVEFERLRLKLFGS